MKTSNRQVRKFDPALARPVTASPEEIRYAEQLRRQLEQRYLVRRDAPDPYWCVGVE